jgi:hypothetical protein
MPSMPWFKLYTEMRSDPKMDLLTDPQFRIWINLLCLAAESGDRGTVHIGPGEPYPMATLAKALGTSTKVLTEAIAKFQKLKMIESDADGIRVTHFVERQHLKPSDEREAATERKRKQRAAQGPGDCHADVTPPVTRVSHPTAQESHAPGHTDCPATEKRRTDLEQIRAEEITTAVAVVSPAPAAADVTPDPSAVVPPNPALAAKPEGLAATLAFEAGTTRESDIAYLAEHLAAGMEPEAIRAGITRTRAKAGARFSYLASVLGSWSAKGIRTLAQVEAEWKRASPKLGKPKAEKPEATEESSYYAKFAAMEEALLDAPAQPDDAA